MRWLVMSVCLHSARPLDSISMHTRFNSDLISSAFLVQSLDSLMLCSLNAVLIIISTRLIDCVSSCLISSLIKVSRSTCIRSMSTRPQAYPWIHWASKRLNVHAGLFYPLINVNFLVVQPEYTWLCYFRYRSFCFHNLTCFLFTPSVDSHHRVS